MSGDKHGRRTSQEESEWAFQEGEVVEPANPSLDDIQITQRLIDVDDGTRYYRYEYVVEELRSNAPTGHSEADDIEKRYLDNAS